MFDEIYRIAIESNSFEELKRKLKKFHIDAITIKDGIPVTTGAQLAREGKNDKVDWMRRLGAGVDAIVLGYAAANNHERAEAYRTQNGADFNVIALGYAVAGNHQRVGAYHKLGAKIDAIGHGYALAGNHARVEAYRKNGASVNAIVLGYAIAGYHEQVEAYDADVNVITMGYAIAGYHELVEDYRKNGADVNAIAHGYARAGNHERVEDYRTQHGADVHAIADGYAAARNHEKQKKYDIIYLLNSYLKERTAVVDASDRTKEYFYGSFFAVFQKSFTQKREAITALKSALNGDNVDLSAHLSALRNGNLGKELRAFVKSGMGNAWVGKDVNTVSDFVQALQDKNSNQQQLS